MLRRTVAVAIIAFGVALTLPPAHGGALDTSGPPRISVGGGSVVEGGMTRRYIRFIVDLSWPSTNTITVQYATGVAGDTALPPGDYRAKVGTITFTPRQTTKQLAVLVWPNFRVDGDRTFTLRLSNPTNAMLGVASGTGTIIDDDGTGTGGGVSVGDATVPETCAGRGTRALVVVTLAQNLGATEVVQVTTSPDTATSPQDYASVARTVTFSSGQILKQVPIAVAADQLAEGTEQFHVNLAYVSGPARIHRASGTVTILDCATT
jgi:hypothetical protein